MSSRLGESPLSPEVDSVFALLFRLHALVCSMVSRLLDTQLV